MKKGKNILAQSAMLCAMLFSAQTLYAQGGMGDMGGFGDDMGFQNEQQSSSQEVITTQNMLTSTGLFQLDSDDVIKKIKVKKGDEAQAEAIGAVVAKYNAEYGELSLKYSKEIEAILAEQTRPSRGGEGSSESGERGERPQRGSSDGSSESGERGERPQRGGEDGRSVSDSSRMQERPQRGGSEDGEGRGMQDGQQRGGMGGQNPMSAKIEAIKQMTEIAKPMHDRLNASMSEILSEKQLDTWNKYYTKLCDKNYVGQIESKMNSRSEGMRGGMGGGMRGGMGGDR